jgi:mannose-6-phosphate isomerase-like protein (cupin superfamily)
VEKGVSKGATVRRVVAGRDAQGHSKVLFDDNHYCEGTRVLWRTDAHPADNSGQNDLGGSPSRGQLSEGSTFLMIARPPGEGWSDLHDSQSIDYIVVLKGHVGFRAGDDYVELMPGDVIIDRGAMHAWSNLGDEEMIMAAVILPAIPPSNG